MKLIFLGEGESVDSLAPQHSTHHQQQHGGVHEDGVHHAAPLVHPQSVVQVEHLLLLLQLLVS